MADDFPRSPKLLKGALAVFDTQKPPAGTHPRVVIFQYNPASIKRTLAERTAQQAEGKQAAAKKPMRQPPVETLTMTVELDATDQLGAKEETESTKVVGEHGLHPALATLELLMYPPAEQAERIAEQARAGRVQTDADKVPLVLLVWGEARVVPVEITGFSVSEEMFDTRLNPIHARVDLGLKVLTYIEYDPGQFGYDAFLAYQRRKEELAGLQQPGDNDTYEPLLPPRNG